MGLCSCFQSHSKWSLDTETLAGKKCSWHAHHATLWQRGGSSRRSRWCLEVHMPFHCVVHSVLNRACYNRNLCIDGGFDICAEMYNKNVLVPLKSFVPKVLISTQILAATVPGSLISTMSDIFDALRIFVISKECTWKRQEIGIRICRQRDNDPLVSVVSAPYIEFECPTDQFQRDIK